MFNELRVLTAHLDELAVKQGEAGAAIKAAIAAVDGAGASVTSTHGSISSATATAVTAAERVRRTASDRMTGQSKGMQDKLAQAAASYRNVDASSAGRVGGSLRPR